MRCGWSGWVAERLLRPGDFVADGSSNAVEGSAWNAKTHGSNSDPGKTRAQRFGTDLCHGLMQDVDRGKPRLVDAPMDGLKFFAEVEKIVLRYEKLDFSDALQIVSVKRGIFGLGVDGSKTLLATADGPLQKAAVQEGLWVWNCWRVLVHPRPWPANREHVA
jgi:hypothetical protein